MERRADKTREVARIIVEGQMPFNFLENQVSGGPECCEE